MPQKIYPRSKDRESIYLKSVVSSPNIIVGGVPAKPIRKRFTQETIDFLLKIKWWNWSEERIRQHITEIQSGNIEYMR